MGWGSCSLTLCWLVPAALTHVFCLQLSFSLGYDLLSVVFTMCYWCLHYILVTTLFRRSPAFSAKTGTFLHFSYNQLCELIWFVCFFITTLILCLSSYFLPLFSESVAGLDFRSPTDVTGKSPWKVPEAVGEICFLGSQTSGLTLMQNFLSSHKVKAMIIISRWFGT